METSNIIILLVGMFYIVIMPLAFYIAYRSGVSRHFRRSSTCRDQVIVFISALLAGLLWPLYLIPMLIERGETMIDLKIIISIICIISTLLVGALVLSGNLPPSIGGIGWILVAGNEVIDMFKKFKKKEKIEKSKEEENE